MTNQLDEMNENDLLENGNNVNVINKKIKIKIGWGSIFLEISLWLLGIVPGIIFLIKKTKTKNFFSKLEQKIQHNASQIDNYIEQRQQIMMNVASIVEKSINLDKDVMTTIAAYRSGLLLNDENRSEASNKIDIAFHKMNFQLENYPELKSHQELQEAMKQNIYLQKEITAAREIYNDNIYKWNESINEWPIKMIVAAQMKYTTRIPFSTSKLIKEQSKKNFFE